MRLTRDEWGGFQLEITHVILVSVEVALDEWIRLQLEDTQVPCVFRGLCEMLW